MWPLDWSFVSAPDRRIGRLSPTFENMQDRGHRWQRLGVKGDLLCMQIGDQKFHALVLSEQKRTGKRQGFAEVKVQC